MKLLNKKTMTKIATTVFSSSLVLLTNISSVQAVLTSQDFSSIPPTSLTNTSVTTPQVMLVMGNDHQLFYKGYDDWSDLNGDGSIESTYTHSIDYYGYFDSYKCYEYDNDVGDKQFEPIAVTTDKYCTDGDAKKNWSGNFLNWATMTRMDILRKVLYGGKRDIDTTNKTILERAYLPSDAHSFAKYYDGADLKKLTPFTSYPDITICNTSYTNDTTRESQTASDKPMMRVVQGDFRYWAANERWQCTWDNEHGDNANGTANNPPSANISDPNAASDGATVGLAGPEFLVRIEVCDDDTDSNGKSLIGKEKCKNYKTAGNDSYKPIGLLHTHGESDNIQFGLLTGSYRFNKSGGVVRKNISTFTNEVDSSNGTFTGVDGIVKTIDLFRISKYEYDNGYYNDSDSCPWGLTSFNDGDCSNWGNPASEMYLEAVRYFAGQSRNNSFSNTTTDDNTYIPGLKNITAWTDPLNVNNYCASCNIIVLNTGEFSYDSDQLSMAGLLGSPNATTLTNNIGVQEGISGNQWFVGESGGDNNQLCTAKTITNLGEVKGICPGTPRLEGTYNMAGIAHWAHSKDIRGLTGDQKVNTYAVSLSPSVPKIVIPVPGSTGKTVKILPACRNSDLTPNGNCAIVDFKIVNPHTEVAGTATGSFYVNWEDSEQGGDYDQDMKGTISYSITSTGITVNTVVDAKYGSYPMGFGYIISGTTDDGFRVHSGVDGFTYTDPDGLNDCNPACNLADGTTSQAYSLGTSTASLLEDPLYYVAKWGGFTDLNGNDVPDNAAEWDNINNDTGAYGPDGLPDNYYLATNPGNLEDQLGNVLTKISERISSGTAAAVIANTTSGTGLIAQALYQPTMSNPTTGDKISWAGLMHAIYIDDYALLREDTNQNDKLDDYATDKTIQFFYDVNLKRTRITRLDTQTDGNGVPQRDVDGKIIHVPLDVVEFENFGSIWNARDELAKLDNSSIVNQRSYTAPVSTNDTRHIITWLDDNKDGIVDSGEVNDFDEDTFTSSNYGYLNIQSNTNGDTDGSGNPVINEADAKNIVNFIRGQENITGTTFRNRTIDYDKDNVKEVWRLGDIVHSSPVISERPSSGWKTKYGDPTYADYEAQYSNRRQVLYVGANDGMLHAFNGGFINAADRSYELTRAQNVYESAAPTEHPLGSELWAYVPKNLLPHLQWLTEVDYNHVYYVDGESKIYDVNIFANDAEHPNGWGTILVSTMRLGGGADHLTDTTKSTTVNVDSDNADSDNNGDTGTDYTARSAVIIMDITNPEKPPVLLAEVSAPGLGFTTSTPTLSVSREASIDGNWYSPAVNDWHLIFGSGPTNLKTATSDQAANIYVLKLNDLATTGYDPATDLVAIPTGDAAAFVGEPESVDWNRDYKFDSTYFGIDSTDATSVPYATNGRLLRMTMTDASDISTWSITPVISPAPGQPFNAKPTITSGWVYAGTGRLYKKNDNTTTTIESFYGIKEYLDPASTPEYSKPIANSYTRASLQNTTDYTVYADGSIEGTLANPLPPGVTNVYQLESYIGSYKSGWYFDFDDNMVITHSRNTTNSLVYDGQLVFNTYHPPADDCQPEGTSRLYALLATAGVAAPDAGFGNSTTEYNAAGSPETPSSIDLGLGMAGDPALYKGNKNDDATIITNKGTGEIATTGLKKKKCLPGNPSCGPGGPGSGGSKRSSWREIFIE